MDDELTHAAILRFEAIEARLDALEQGGSSGVTHHVRGDHEDEPVDDEVNQNDSTEGEYEEVR